MIQERIEVIENRHIKSRFYAMSLHSPQLSSESNPGQFIHIRCGDGLYPLLRRPFSIHGTFEGGVEIIYEVVGKGTALLREKKPGDHVDVIGPIGRGFRIEGARKPAIIVAGGMGVAPLTFLARRIPGRKLVFLGARTLGLLLCREDFSSLGAEVFTATDDGSEGYAGFVSELLRNSLVENPRMGGEIFACGPTSMLRAVSEVAEKYEIPAQVSLHNWMGCGVGACLGCAIKMRNSEYRRVCVDGPVFYAHEIDWSEMPSIE
ncbi:MAG: dihydroorotate dehydrogenase electron transfer subunit [bacterium]